MWTVWDLSNICILHRQRGSHGVLVTGVQILKQFMTSSNLGSAVDREALPFKTPHICVNLVDVAGLSSRSGLMDPWGSDSRIPSVRTSGPRLLDSRRSGLLYSQDAWPGDPDSRTLTPGLPGVPGPLDWRRPCAHVRSFV